MIKMHSPFDNRYFYEAFIIFVTTPTVAVLKSQEVFQYQVILFIADTNAFCFLSEVSFYFWYLFHCYYIVKPILFC